MNQKANNILASIWAFLANRACITFFTQPRHKATVMKDMIAWKNRNNIPLLKVFKANTTRG